MKFGILTVSDSCYNGQNIDKSGPTLRDLIKIYYVDGFINEDKVPDDFDQIKNKLIEWSDNNIDVILTTGGTGLSPRDVTPEATKSVLDKEIPGIMFAMLEKSLQITPYAMLSRAVAGSRKKSLIINFPGSVKAVKEHFQIVYEIIPHAVAVIKDEKPEVTRHHKDIQNQDKIEPSKVKVDCVAGRDRESKYQMIEVAAALKTVTLFCGQTSDTEFLNINDALGRVLAEDVRSLDPLPPFPASIKDGYAVKFADGVGVRKVCDVKAAGDDPNSKILQPGFCVRISTGAPVPPGADAVVQVEDTTLKTASDDLSQEITIDVLKQPTLGQDIRQTGSDMAAFSIVLPKGSVINAPETGVLAAVGKTQVKVFKRPAIGIISTGNEIQDPKDVLQPGKIRDSNKNTLINLLRQYSYSAEDYGVARDDPTCLKEILIKAFENCEFVITTGGVSMGEFDLLKEVLIQDFNATIHFGRINMKPGKPTTFATCLYKGHIKTIFGLPGNPVSATVTCFLFVIPALRFRENRNKFQHDVIHVATEQNIVGDTSRPDYQRVSFKMKNSVNCYIPSTLNSNPAKQSDSSTFSFNTPLHQNTPLFSNTSTCNHSFFYLGVETTGNQISSKLNSFAGADGLMLVPPQTNSKGPFSCYLLKNY